ncbi:exonuclease domain-containing protein [Georgenia subflava]|uniref:DNA polymerase III subunit epsilon n=1 Tax=Georgenia subflava TaxID=1622177 RepID=A0A6N7EL72_9MICO|nr:exonuclease domain-containing protein [Georgenia subflava]MPV37838.1 DNA polymerase III subunit epsilon [Georgenia subflava]
MSSWSAGPLLGFDTETTGVDVTTDRIVTAALVRRDARGTSVRTWIIDPGVEIPAPASAIHGISTERARAEGVAPALALEEIAAQLVEAQRDGVPVVAFNAAYDLAILEHELARHGLPGMGERLSGDRGTVLDPLVLDRYVDGARKGPRKLVDLCELYLVPTGDLHTAEVDVVATLDLLAAMAGRHPQLSGSTPAQLHVLQVAAHEDWVRSYNRWRARRGLPWPGDDQGWPTPSRPSRRTRLVRRATWYLDVVRGLPRRLVRRLRRPGENEAGAVSRREPQRREL